MKLQGIITATGVDVDGKIFTLPIRGTDPEGYDEVLIDATNVGGNGIFSRQSIKPYLGMNVTFITNNNRHGFNFTLTKP
jgi:hypothetical protein